MGRSAVRPPVLLSEFTGFRFLPEVIVLAVRWFLRFTCPTGMSRRCSPAVELLMFVRWSPVGTHVFEDEVLDFA